MLKTPFARYSNVLVCKIYFVFYQTLNANAKKAFSSAIFWLVYLVHKTLIVNFKCPKNYLNQKVKIKQPVQTKLLNYFYMEIVQLFNTHVVFVRHLKMLSVYFGRALGLVITRA